MRRTDLQHWIKLWHSLRADGDPAVWHKRLVAAYSEPRRHYHNLQHLDECLLALDAARTFAVFPALIEAALWFHDAVYDPRSSANEEDSATFASFCFSAAGIPAANIDAIRTLILCTKSHQPGTDADAALLIDIDLAILGQPASRFLEYERGIRAEYAWVPSEIFARKRAEILSGFLQRPAIYHTDHFRNRYEDHARTNLRQTIQALTAGAR